ncbi:MAG: MaoC family dehydratase [Candidatus Eremiobacteraeota bacterium]|nr:MaoC family dehydratase [Candidatus Eremiobacteraeota bacterium]
MQIGSKRSIEFSGGFPVGVHFEEGQHASLSRKVTLSDVEAFARVSGDHNPMHLDETFAAASRFKKRIAHGLLSVSYISAVLGSRLPGPGTIYLSQSVSFRAPVFLDDVITATVTVVSYRRDKQILTLRTECTNQQGRVVVEGQAVCLVSDIERSADSLEAAS